MNNFFLIGKFSAVSQKIKNGKIWNMIFHSIQLNHVWFFLNSREVKMDKKFEHYFWLLQAVRGAKPGMKKLRRGKGSMWTTNLRKSAFNSPGNLKADRHEATLPRNYCMQPCYATYATYHGYCESKIKKNYTDDPDDIVGTINWLFYTGFCNGDSI